MIEAGVSSRLSWRDKMPRIKSISSNASGRAGGCAIAATTAFLGLFVVVGCIVGFFMSARPLYHAFAARGWTPTECEVVSSRVVRSDDTARPDIVYRYTIGGREYIANRYNFLPGTNNDSNVSGVVTMHSPGKKFECYVDPADPSSAVINRTPTPWYFMGVPFFVMFAGIPAAIATVMFRSRRRAFTASQALSGGVGAGTSASGNAGASSRFAPHATSATNALSAADDGPIVLKPSASPLGKLIAITLICLFWNGIVGIFTFIEYRMFMQGDAFGWGMAIFLLLFQAVGVVLLAAVPYQALALANPRPIITLNRGTVPLGGSASFTYELSGAAHRVTQLRITLRGSEVARYRRGTDTKTDTHVFFDETIADAAHAMNIARGSGVIRIPVDTMHSFDSPNNKVVWTLHVAGDIPRWPNIDETFDITVRTS
jgi:hypothetical protein